MPGLFGNLFDLNGDGKMSDFEKSVEMDHFDKMTRNVKQKDGNQRTTSDWLDIDRSRDSDD